MTSREYLRTTLDRLPALMAEGWRPAVELECGAIGIDPFSAGTGAGVTVWREMQEETEVLP